MRVLVAVILLLLRAVAVAQEQERWNDYMEEMAAGDGGEEASWDGIHDVLSYYADNPIDINTATREELEQLPFLTDDQIEQICEYVYRYGPLRTPGELAMLDALDSRRRKLLGCFITVGEGRDDRFPTLREIAGGGHGSLVATADVPFYERRGDRSGYAGYKYKHWLRCDFKYSDRLRIGLTASQDAGEPFFAAPNRAGYDYYSVCLLARRLGPLETLAVGRYRVSAGMGLVVNTSTGFGKTAALGSLGRGTEGIRPHLSRSEEGYMQGVAATARLSGRLTATAFLSYRALDATLNADGSAATLITSGYHRTLKEIEKKNNTHAATAGAAVRYVSGRFHAGITAVATRLDRRLSPDLSAVYRRYYPAGTDFLNVGISYGYTGRRLSFSGETATDRHGAMATMNRLGLTLSSSLSLMLLQRFYSYRYTALHASCFSDGGRVQNESGACLGAEWRPSARVRLSAYTDLARFVWPRYRVSGPSLSSDNMVSLTVTRRRWTLSGRYRLRLRQRDNAGKTALMTVADHRSRIAATCSLPCGLTATSQAQMALCDAGGRSFGWMISQSASFAAGRFNLGATAGYFDTDGYDSQVYLYERAAMYTFSCPAYYGHGLRYALTARADLSSRIMLMARLGVTDYFDRTSIGSGYQTVSASSVADMEMQMKVAF